MAVDADGLLTVRLPPEFLPASLPVCLSEATSLLQVDRLVEAKNTFRKRVVRPTHSLDSMCVEHWGFDKLGAQRSWLSSDKQFKRCFGEAMSRVGLGSPRHKGSDAARENQKEAGLGLDMKGIESLGSSAKGLHAPVVPFAKRCDENDAKKVHLPRPPSSPLGPDDLPPPIPAEGLSSPDTHRTETLSASAEYIGGANFGEQSYSDSVLEDVESPQEQPMEVQRLGNIHAMGGYTVETFEYVQIKTEKPQRGEWFHSYGVNRCMMDTLRDQLGVQQMHLSLVSEHHEERYV